MKIRLYILYIMNKITVTTENRSTVLHHLLLLDMSRKTKSFFVLMEGVQLHHDQVLVLEDRTFHCRVLSRLYRNSNFNILANFNLVLSTS